MNFRTISKRILLSVALVTAFHVAQSKPLLSSSADDLQWLAPYNVVWTNQSLNASESMPCGGGDLGLNVWVENGELLCYLQRSGSFDENNEYLKLGRLRVRLEPNPFVAGGAFRQELKLREGHVEITGQAAALRAKVKVWVEVHRSVIHVEVEASQPVAVNAAYENWRLEDNLLPGKPGKGERFGCFSWEGYPGEIFRYRDEVRQDDAGVWFNHRNRDDKLLFDYMVRQQGLEKAREQLVDTQKGRTFGGVMCGDGFVGDGTGEGVYQNTPFKAW